MSFRKYVANSARDAMNRIRIELGPDAIILSNRRSDETGRVEIIAAAPDEMRALVNEVSGRATAPSLGGSSSGKRAQAVQTHAVPAVARQAARTVKPMSFQEFVRQQSAAGAAGSAADKAKMAVAAYTSSGDDAAAAAVPDLSVVERRRPMTPEQLQAPAVFRRRPSREVPVSAAAPAVPADAPQKLAVQAPAAQDATASVLEELNRLKSSLTDRLAVLESQIAATPAAPAPLKGSQVMKRHIMTRLIIAGFSTALARRFAERIPDGIDMPGADAWLQDQVAAGISCPIEAQSVLSSPGAVALVGPTGVGKTTTVAKLAARFVVRHGAASLGLITLDSYRVGAHDQLRSYGRILGVPVQVAHDLDGLQNLLNAMQGKRKVLIDTCGISQRDNRLAEALEMLRRASFAGQPLSQVLVLNAASHSETLDEVTRAWRNAQTRGAIISKLDEAARIGGAVDAVIRHQIDLLGVTNGQRVPEDWHPANAKVLAHLIMKPAGETVSMDRLTSDAVQAAAMASTAA